MTAYSINTRQPDSLKRPVRRFCLFIIVTSILSACANIKRILPFQEIKPQDVEPRLTFVDSRKIITKPSHLKPVKAEQVIRSYERLLERGDKAVRREALHRLASLHMRLAESELSLAEDSASQAQAAALKQASFTQAITYYNRLLVEFPDYAAADEIKYQLARAHALDADPESSLAVLDQLSRKHIDSPSYVESQFRRGESYFVRKQYRVAEMAYGEVLKRGSGTDFYEKALYKKGWSLFKQSLFKESLKDFFTLYERVLNQRKQKTGDEKLLTDLAQDTRRVISLAFYNMEGANSVKGHFETSGRRAYEDQIYGSLSELYIEQERFKDAADTYMGFIERNPLSLSAPEFHSRVIDIYRKGGFPSLILPAKERFVKGYGRQSLFWQKYSGKVIDDLKPLLKTHLIDVSTFYHAQAQKSSKPSDYLIAAQWYREILKTFEDPVLDSKYRFLLAETLEQGGQVLMAAKEYEIVAYHNPTSQYARDAGYRALVAYQGVSFPDKTSLRDRLTPSIQSGLRFSTAFATDKEAASILARVAEQQLQLNDIQMAIDSSQRLLTSPFTPNTKQKIRARIIVANGLFDLKRYAEAEVAISLLLKSSVLSKADRNNFEKRRVESIYKLAENARTAGEIEQAVGLFNKVTRLQPRSKIAATALFDASALLLQSEQWSRATTSLEKFRKVYPGNPLVKSVPEKLALAYENQEKWAKAAKEYQYLAKVQSDPQLAREGFWRVAELYLKAGQDKKAISAFKHYVWTYPQPYELAQEGRYNLVNLYSKAGDSGKRSFWQQKIIQQYSKNKNSNNSRTRYLAAESKFLLSEPLFSQFKKIKLRLPLAASLKKKRAAMKKALTAYNAIAQYNVAEYTTASTLKVAQIYQILSQDLMSSQRPKGLSEDEAEEYGFLLEDQALPFEDKAIDFYEINAKRTVDSVYDTSVKASIEALRKLKPAQFDKVERLEVFDSVQF